LYARSNSAFAAAAWAAGMPLRTSATSASMPPGMPLCTSATSPSMPPGMPLCTSATSASMPPIDAIDAFLLSLSDM